MTHPQESIHVLRPTRETLLRRAEALRPQIAARAAEAEALRRLPDSTHADFHASGLYRAMQPARVGGAELGIDAIVDITEIVARECASSAWVLGNLAVHHWMLGLFRVEAQDEVWGESPDTLAAAALSFPNGIATPVEGGVVISGRWPYSSGVHVSPWNMLGVTVRDAAGAPVDWYLALVRSSDTTIHDNWDSLGLRGSGSVDVEARDLFVPSHRLLRPRDASGGPSPGSAVNPGWLFRVPMISVAPFSLTGVAIGNARAAFAAALAIVKGRSSTNTAISLAGIASVQQRLGEASGLIAAARLLVDADMASVNADAAASRVPDLEEKLRLRRDCARAVAFCTQAVELAWSTAGAGGLPRGTALERAYRDSKAIASSLVFNTDSADTAYGQALVGRPGNFPTF